MFTKFAQPKNFHALTDVISPYLAAFALLFLGIGLYHALIISPPDYQQGDMVRVMYIHVPAAWLALMNYAAMGCAAISYLVWRHVVAEMMLRALAPLGATLAAICLVTGMLWGEPTWGTFWVWDARLTSVLILFLIYIALIILTRSENAMHNMAPAAWLTIIGLINLPIIKFSVDWWSTLHQTATISSLSRIANPALPPEMLQPLLLMFAAYFCWWLWLGLLRTQTLLWQRQQLMRAPT
ncbi:MAG TPA: heme ABC transporter permease CcmC [Alphaproteobacteria bacterium]|nr:heme transporter HemC [Rhodospirillaceae bacterium]HRJ13101.1 heme ABC transporter permease CcmC [Alphaproteobacteria bacterium]